MYASDEAAVWDQGTEKDMADMGVAPLPRDEPPATPARPTRAPDNASAVWATRTVTLTEPQLQSATGAAVPIFSSLG